MSNDLVHYIIQPMGISLDSKWQLLAKKAFKNASETHKY